MNERIAQAVSISASASRGDKTKARKKVPGLDAQEES